MSESQTDKTQAWGLARIPSELVQPGNRTCLQRQGRQSPRFMEGGPLEGPRVYLPREGLEIESQVGGNGVVPSPDS